ncbi:PAS domain S-box protein [Haloarcula pellucida]|uniref:PAS domain S-box-containing protein n=1 Tax=Haloarcula pellucida TaxID=1427151 RepID=A0A830GJU1_9EURY|nr:PAS domain S-box protein [Halomicroarcula pellucida]MBX0350435.1 PAS domain S-box protein [Halomicroarcula pellucida]GGN90965.1 hypothetical protein GCM10009030_13490 [Halomicroarcula pellucida]
MSINQGQSARRVLYVGAESLWADGLRSAVGDAGEARAERTVRTAADALEAVESESVAAVVAQYDLPDGDGLSMLSRCLDAHSGVLTILVAEECSRSLLERAYEAGIDEVVHYTGPEKRRLLSHHLQNYLGTDESATWQPRLSEHMTSLATTMSDAILSVDEESVVRYANPAVEDVFGYEPEALLGEPLTVLMSDELAARHVAGMQRYLATDERTIDWDDVELVGQHKDGHSIPLSISFSEFRVGSDRYFTGVMRDITDRKRLRAERELYHDTTQRILQADSFEDGLHVGLEAVGSAMDWQYGEAWVRSAEDHLERVPGWYVASESAEAFANATSPISFEPGSGLVGHVWESGSPEWVTDITTDEAPFVRASAADDAGLRAALGVPILSDHTVVAVMAFFLDETREPDEAMIEATTTVAADLGRLLRRLKTETALREERELKDRILETSPVGIVIVDEDDTFRYINDRAADIMGIDAYEGPVTEAALDAELLGFEGVPVDEHRRPHDRIIQDGETIGGEALLRIDGETRWLSVRGAPLRGEEAAVTSAVYSLQDVTDRKERERRLQRQQAVMQTVRDGLYAVDAEGTFVAVNDAYTELTGYDREELVGSHASEFVDARVTDEARSLQADTDANGHESATFEAVLTTADGGQVPIETHISPFEFDDEGDGWVAVVRDITDRKRREERLASLNEIGQALTAAETAGEVADIVVGGAREILDLPLTTVQYYDEAAGRLRSAAQTAALETLVGDGPVFSSDWGVPSQVYAESEGRVVADLEQDDSLDEDETPLESAIILPVGTHGVFIAGATETDAFTDADVMVAKILVANAVAALDRVDRERELREKTARLAEHNESLHRINRLNDIIRGLTQELTQAATRDDIERAVCENLTDADPYVFGWIAEQRASGTDVVPRASSGDDEGYLEWFVDADAPASDETPTETAIRTHEPVVENNLHADPPLEPWQTQALKSGYHASIAVPLMFRETVYGVLNLYADETGTFDGMETAVLAELGTMIGYAINAIERKKALVSDGAVELRFTVDDETIPPLQLCKATDSEFEFDELVQHSDGSIRVFFTVTGSDPEAVYRYSDEIPSVHEVNLLTKHDDTCRYEAMVGDSGFLAELVAYGAHPTAVTASADGGEVCVELPQSGDVQSFVRMFLERYEGSELAARTERDTPVQTLAEFEANFRDRLTERQREVLETAYFSGFFEWPRETTGQELAEMLDISQPTVSRHIRTGERELFELVFDGDD